MTATEDISIKDRIRNSLWNESWTKLSDLLRFQPDSRGWEHLTPLLEEAYQEQRWSVVQRVSLMIVCADQSILVAALREATSPLSLLHSLLKARLPRKFSRHLLQSCSRLELLTLMGCELAYYGNQYDYESDLQAFEYLHVKVPQNQCKPVGLYLSLLMAEGKKYFPAIVQTVKAAYDMETSHGVNPYDPLIYNGVSWTFFQFWSSLLSVKPSLLVALMRHLEGAGEACGYFSFLLAVELGQWRYALKRIQQNDRLRYASAKFYVFHRALSQGAVHLAAIYLESFSRNLEVELVGPSTDDSTPHEEKIMVLWEKTPLIRRLLAACTKRRFHAAGSLVSLLMKWPRSAERFMRRPYTGPDDIEYVLDTVFGRSLFLVDTAWSHKQLTRFLFILAQGQPDPLGPFLVLQKCDLQVDQKLIRFCLSIVDPASLRLAENRSWFLWNMDNYVSHPDLLRVILTRQLHMIYRTQQGRCYIGDRLLRSCLSCTPPAMQSFRMLLESGVTVHSGTPIPGSRYEPFSWQYLQHCSAFYPALLQENISAMGMLVQAGATTQRELLLLTDSWRAVEPDLKPETVECLRNLACTPLKLQCQAIIAVSKTLGCGPDRKDRALQLPLSIDQVSRVLFYDFVD